MQMLQALLTVTATAVIALGAWGLITGTVVPGAVGLSAFCAVLTALLLTARTKDHHP